MVWDEMDNRQVKAKGLTSAQHLWELPQDCWKTSSGDDFLKLTERMLRVCKAVVKAKGGDVKSKTRSDCVQGFVHYLITSVFIHSFDAFNENLQCQ